MEQTAPRLREVGKRLRRPERDDPSPADRTNITVPHSVLERQFKGPAIDTDRIQHAGEFCPRERRKAHSSRHQAYRMAACHEGEPLVDPSCWDIRMYETGLAQFDPTPIAKFCGKTIGSQDAQNPFSRQNVVQAIEHALWCGLIGNGEGIIREAFDRLPVKEMTIGPGPCG